ncbi:ABC transporter substrate-binding protein [Cohnella sp. 56]|uniref:ABC transporter substrate-binding protein n=1 Tax=Cohnella sp. 56 TaxID=3113722 RepID=UPI0030E7F2C3
MMEMKVKGWLVLLAMMMFLAACTQTQTQSQSGDKKTVVIAVQGTNPFLEAAAGKFEREHPDIDIEIKSYMAMPEADGSGMTSSMSQADIEKYIQTVTTQIMAGKGSDLILLDNLPQNKLVEKKVLVNLYDWMEKDSAFDKDDYYENVFKAAQDGAGLYALPVGVNLEVIQGNLKLLNKANIKIDDGSWTWDQFKAIARKLNAQEGQDYYAFVNLFPANLLLSYIEDNYADLVQRDGQANFDSDSFRDMMRQIKSMYDEHVLQAEFTYDYDKALFSQAVLPGPEEGLRLMTMPGKEIFKSPTAKGESKGIPYSSWLNLGMNSKSKVQQEAWQFIKFLLSEEMQQSPELSGFPVNKKAAEKRIDEAASKIKGDPAAAQAKADELKQLLKQTDVKLSTDFKVQSIAIAEFETYMSGQKTAAEVSKLIQNKVTTYLNE